VLSADPAQAPTRSQLRALRRGVVGYVPQDALAALTPTMRVGALLAEALGHAGRPEGDDGQASRAADDPVGPARTGLLALVDLPTDPAFLRRLPHQLSGGQRQRLALAMALAGAPAVVVRDEPTAGQDPETRAALIGQLRRLRQRTGSSFVVITHEPHTAELGRRQLRLSAGRPTDVTGSVAAGAHSAGVRRALAPRARSTEVVLAARGLRVSHTPVRRGVPQDALREVGVGVGVEVSVRAGECLGVIGLSGSGKTTLLRALAGLHPVGAGTVHLDGVPVDRRAADRPPALRRRLAMVFRIRSPASTRLAGSVASWPTRPGSAVPPRTAPSSDSWPRSDWSRRTPAATLGSCPAASSSGWPSPGRWRRTRPSRSPTR
jgi:peptide/nickel transport system ATP-binding protein